MTVAFWFLGLGLCLGPGAVPADDAGADVSADTPAAGVGSGRPARQGRAERARQQLEHLRFGGFMQVDFLRRQISEDELSDGTREPLNETAFVLRNARVGVDADWEYVGSRAYAEFFANGNGVRPATFDVHAQYRGVDGRPLVQFRAGLLRVPFGFENYGQTDVQRFFGERTLMSRANVPGLFDTGVSLSGSVWALDWIVAAHNGQPLDAPGFAFADPNRAKDFSGRIRLSGKMFPWLNAAIGISLLRGTGFSAGTPATKDTFDWVDLNEDGRLTVAELIPVPGAAGRASENFRRWGFGSDIQLWSEIPVVGALVVYGELALASNLDRAVSIADPVLSGRQQRSIGWYVAGTQALTQWASVGIRYDEYYPDLDALEPFDGRTVLTRRSFKTVSSGVAAHVHDGPHARGRLLLEYERQRNQLGRDSSGRPAHLPNDTLRVRAEVVF